MTDCKLEMESPFVFIVLLVIVLLSLAYTVHASGAYMNAVRGRFNKANILISKTQSPTSDGTDLNFTDSQLPKISDNAHQLRDADAKFALCNGIDIREITISQIQVLFNENKLNSVDLTNCYLQRIHRMNPILRAVIEVNSDAIAEATQADKERTLYKKIRGPMHGIPVLLKDNIGTADFMETTAGSLALVGLRVKKSADVVKHLRKSGAVIIGKTNLSEFAKYVYDEQISCMTINYII